MNEIIPFIYEDQPVRVILDDKKDPWWVARDVCNILGIKNVTDAIKALDDDEKNTLEISEGIMGISGNTVTFSDSIPPKRGNPNVNIINEPGLYTLIIRSTKPKARVFRRWITHEVLPSIRKTGGYAMNPPENGPGGDDSAVDRQIPGYIWQRIRAAGKGVRLSYRVKLLSLACQMNRLDQTMAPTRAGVLLDYAELCSNICTAPELPTDNQEENVIADFIGKRCYQEAGANVQAADIYAQFCAWYLENEGDDVPTATWFGRRLARRFEKTKSQGVILYHGIGLRDEEDALAEASND